MSNPNETQLYGVMAEFATPEAVIHATEQTREAGYKEIDAYSPYPIHELIHAAGHHTSKLPLIVLIGGLLGMIGGFSLQYWASVIEYPMNIGGRPFNSWPAFIVPTFECTILAAALSAVFGMFFLNGLPMPYHPVFNVKRFAMAGARDRYFLVIKKKDPKFDAQEARRFLESFDPSEVSDVDY